MVRFLVFFWSRVEINEILGRLVKGWVIYLFFKGFKGGLNKILKSYDLRGCKGDNIDLKFRILFIF